MDSFLKKVLENELSQDNNDINNEKSKYSKNNNSKSFKVEDMYEILQKKKQRENDNLNGEENEYEYENEDEINVNQNEEEIKEDKNKIQEAEGEVERNENENEIKGKQISNEQILKSQKNTKPKKEKSITQKEQRDSQKVQRNSQKEQKTSQKEQRNSQKEQKTSQKKQKVPQIEKTPVQKQNEPKEKKSTNSFKFEKRSSKKSIIKTQSKERIPTGKEIFNTFTNSNDSKYENKEENQMNINSVKSNYRKSGDLLFNPKISKNKQFEPLFNKYEQLEGQGQISNITDNNFAKEPVFKKSQEIFPSHLGFEMPYKSKLRENLYKTSTYNNYRKSLNKDKKIGNENDSTKKQKEKLVYGQII